MIPASLAKYVAEFIGTFLLVFTIGCNVLTGQSIWGAVSIASVLSVMIYALGSISGAHFNPAVSVALGCAGKMEDKGGWEQVVTYCCVQIFAGICAGVFYVMTFGESFNLKPLPGHTWLQAGLAELLYTFVLCFVVLNVTSKIHGGDEFYGLAIGFVIIAGAYSGGSISMGCFNPAVAFGIDVSSAYHGVKYCFIYTIFEMLGAVGAAGAFTICRKPQEDQLDKTNSMEEAKSVCDTTARALSEFLGTYILVVTVGLNVLSGSHAGAFSIAAALMCMIYALGTVSGAHFNPAVTVAAMCSSKGSRDKVCPWEKGLMMIGVQIFAGICGAVTYSALMNGKRFPMKPEGYKWSQALIAEFMFTLVLTLVVLCVATSKTASKNFFGFAIGMCVTVGGSAIGKISGGCLNPAVAIGVSSLNVVAGVNLWPCIIYSLVEIAAGVVAAIIFQVTHPSEFSEKIIP
jgi:aquaporin Z